jgi:hypothetical protein
MRGILITVLILAAATAWAGPRGISGPAVGFGGMLGDAGFLGAELDYAVSPYFTWGPEVMIAFGGGVGVFGGAASRVYVIPNYNYLAQPYFAFGGGLAGLFGDDDRQGRDEDDNHVGGYLHFGAGNDFDIPETKIVPYVDLGALVFISDYTDTVFKIEIGVRFGAM